MEGLEEKFAEKAHEIWAKGANHILSSGIENEDGSITIRPEFVERWQRQIKTPYSGLTEKEKESDRRQARIYLEILKDSPIGFIFNDQNTTIVVREIEDDKAFKARQNEVSGRVKKALDNFKKNLKE